MREKRAVEEFFDHRVLYFLICCPSPPLGVVGESSPLQAMVGTAPASLITSDKSMAAFRKLPPGSPLGPALEQWEASLADKGLLAALTCCLKSNGGNLFILFIGSSLPSRFVLGKVLAAGRGVLEGGVYDGSGEHWGL